MKCYSCGQFMQRQSSYWHCWNCDVDVDFKEELVKREWNRCKDCEHREIKIGNDNKNHSFCMFWDNFLYRIQWCNK